MKHENGFALIYALIVMVVVGILVTGALFNALTSQTVASNDRGATLAQVVSEAGLTRFVAITNQNVAFLQGYEPDGKRQYIESYNLFDRERQVDNRGDAACGSGEPLSAGGLDLDFAKGEGGGRGMDVLPNRGAYFPVTLPDGTEAGYIIRLKGETITSEGYIGGTVEGCPGESCNVKDARAKATNAVRLGKNQAPGGVDSAITVKEGFGSPLENVSVYGSVRSFEVGGENEPVLDLRGTTGIYNDYYGRGPDTNVSERVDELGAYKISPDLCARMSLRGNLALNTSSVVLGTKQNKLKDVSLGPAFKRSPNRAPQPRRAVNESGNDVSDRWDGVNNAHFLDSQTGRADAEPPQAPGLAEDFPAGADLTLTPQTCPQLFRQAEGGAVVSSPDIHLPPADPASGFECANPLNPALRIAWRPGSEGEPGRLEFVHPPNDALGNLRAGLTVSTGGADVIVSENMAYEGKGTFWVGESGEDKKAQVIINGSLAPHNSDDDAFLKHDVLSFVSSGDVTVGADADDPADAADIDVAALLYAHEKMDVGGKTLLFGAVMADELTLGSQGVSVAWDPRLINLCPSGVPGCPERPARENGLSLTVEAYERR